MRPPHEHNPVQAGTFIAALAAIAFGVTTPLIKRLGAPVQPFTTASLLYAGASIASVVAGGSRAETPLPVAQIPRLVLVALLGAVFAPVCLAWGLQHTDAVAASLLLNFEAVFTVLLARAFFAEPIGKRMTLALAAMATGGALLVTGGRAPGDGTVFRLGAIAVIAASLGWASDNALTRPLSDFDPARVVFWKASLGAALSAAVAALMHESWPHAANALGLAACGTIGYGVSLRLYLLAQRRIGAARTGSIFAVAPFVGAVVAWLMGDRAGGWVDLGAGGLFVAAVYLHMTERHRHAHRHDAVEHEHSHRHDDGHHTHLHEPAVTTEHSHWHRHEPLEHEHLHGLDIHHRHRHD
jgi:drug/metabolite transporter (DMT)-like permease